MNTRGKNLTQNGEIYPCCTLTLVAFLHLHCQSIVQHLRQQWRQQVSNASQTSLTSHGHMRTCSFQTAAGRWSRLGSVTGHQRAPIHAADWWSSRRDEEVLV